MDLKEKQEKRLALETEVNTFITERAEKYPEGMDGERSANWPKEDVQTLENMTVELEDLDKSIAEDEAKIDERVSPDELLARIRAREERASDVPGGNIPVYGGGNPYANLTMDDFSHWVKYGFTPSGLPLSEFPIAMPVIEQDEGKRAMMEEIMGQRVFESAAGAGANIVPGESINRIINALYVGDPLRQAGAEVITTTHGRDEALPVFGTGSDVPIVAEKADSEENDPSVADNVLKAYVRRGWTKWTRELTEDSAMEFISKLDTAIRDTVAETRGKLHTVGDGQNKELGIVNAFTTATAGATQDVLDAGLDPNAFYSVAQVIELTGLVADPYHPRAVFMGHRRTLNRIIALAASSAQGGMLQLIQPTNAAGRVTIMGYPFIPNHHMQNGVASANANQKQLLFFDPFMYKIRDVNQLMVERDTQTGRLSDEMYLWHRLRGDGRYVQMPNISGAALQR